MGPMQTPYLDVQKSSLPFSGFHVSTIVSLNEMFLIKVTAFILHINLFQFFLITFNQSLNPSNQRVK